MTQMLFIIFLPRFISLRRPALTQNSTRSPFGYPMIFHGLFHHLPTPCRAYKFPDATSFKIALSRLKSATKRFNLVFSFSNPLNRLAWSIRYPPYSLRQRINVCSQIPSFFAASIWVRPLVSSISASRSFTMICSGLNRCRGIIPPAYKNLSLTFGIQFGG